jgi:hypothetical protein
MTATPKKKDPLLKLYYKVHLACRTFLSCGEAVVFWEDASKCTRETLRGRCPSTYTKIAEKMSGRANSQQGLTATCKDLLM